MGRLLGSFRKPAGTSSSAWAEPRAACIVASLIARREALRFSAPQWTSAFSTRLATGG